MNPNISNKDYYNWLKDLKVKIRTNQLKAILAVNATLINFYWEIGKMISEKEKVWGSKLIEQVSKDLKEEFPDLIGFSTRNLKYCKYFYDFYSAQIGQQAVAQFERDDYQDIAIVQQLVAQIPWGHNIVIFTKSKVFEEAFFYLNKTIENQWSRSVLEIQIENNLYTRQGKAISNFTVTLPNSFSDLAQQTLKDPYVFNFLSLDEKFQERDIENQLIFHIQNFLLELGKGFAFVGRQYHLNISESDYYIDLLFYHIHLKCYVVIELKNNKFIPEYAGKLNFYLSAVDTLLKLPEDNPTIGLLLCKNKNNIEAEFALRDMKKPMGVSEFLLVESLPENLKSSLPTIEEIEKELSKI